MQRTKVPRFAVKTETEDLNLEKETKMAQKNENSTALTKPEADLIKLLNEWGFGHLYKELKEQELSVERLEYLTESDLRELPGLWKVGDKAHFRHKLMTWRKKNFIDNPWTCDVSYNRPDDMPINDFDGYKISATTLNSIIKNIKFDEVLMDIAAGPYVLRTYNELKKLDHTARMILVDAIITWFIKRNIKLANENIEAISEGIAARFQDDKLIYYKNGADESNDGGCLYSCYYKTLRKYDDDAGSKL